ncbi:MAG: dTDP-4-dehydrorhamnose 3,5-epimerase [Proteobacteria bacterium]|nr:dTDP-4-dehydrorhamnose 3,5-epimerase [Pseudomonadota bacterium]
MIFTETELSGAFVVEPERLEDARGFFARTWCAEEFDRMGLNPNLVQCSTSFNARRGTLRGLHYQAPPHAETKLVRCTMGRIFDVIVDLRADSPTRGKWTALVLSAENRAMIYIPEGFAHGFQTLADDSEVFYQISAIYAPEASRGIRWDDPDLAIDWPRIEERVISERDDAFPSFSQTEPLAVPPVAQTRLPQAGAAAHMPPLRAG